MDPRRPVLLLVAFPLACTIGPVVPELDPSGGDSSATFGPGLGESSSGDVDLGDVGDDGALPGDLPVCDPDDPCAALPEYGRLYMDRCGVPEVAVAHVGVRCDEALSFCRDVGEHFGDPVYCELNDVVIHRAGDPSACAAMYGSAEVCDPPPCFDPCRGRGDALGLALAHVGCQDTGGLSPEIHDRLFAPQTCTEALVLCTAIAAEHAENSLVCTWNDEVIFWRELTPGQCDHVGPPPPSCDDPEG